MSKISDTNQKNMIRQSDGYFAVAMLAGLALIVAGFVAWSIFSPLHIRVIAPGEVTGDAQIVEIRAVTSGVVAEMNVQNGQYVEAGDILVSLETDKLEEQHRLAASKIARLECQIRNLESELGLLATQEAELAEIIEKGEWTPDTLEQYKPACPDEFASYRIKLLADRIALNLQRIRYVRQRVVTLDQQIELGQQQLGSIEQDLQAARALLDQQLSRQSQVREFERAAGEIRMTILGQAAERQALQNDRLQAAQQIRVEFSQHVASLASTLAANRLERINERLTLESIEMNLDNRVMISPTSGTIVYVNNNIVSNFAQQSELLLKILPESRPLFVAARVSIDDIDNIKQSDAALIQFPTIVALRNRTFGASIRTVNPIASAPTANAVPFYEVMLEITDADYHPASGELYVGTPVEILFTAEETTLAGALLRPITQNWPRVFEN